MIEKEGVGLPSGGLHALPALPRRSCCVTCRHTGNLLAAAGALLAACDPLPVLLWLWSVPSDRNVGADRHGFSYASGRQCLHCGWLTVSSSRAAHHQHRMTRHLTGTGHALS